MASINGISIKSLKVFKGHEGEPLRQGNVYYNGKKLGFWSQDAWGGCDSYDFDERILQEEVERYKLSDRVEDKYKDLFDSDLLLNDLCALIDDEKIYKKGMKQGYSTYVFATDGYHVAGYYCGEKDVELVKKSITKAAKESFFKNWDEKISVYKSLDDFIITV